MMDRRTFLAGTGAMLLAAPLAAEAQRPGQILPRIGFLGIADAKSAAEPFQAFRQGLHELGWIEGQTITMEYRWANGQAERLPALASELVRAKSDIIVVSGSIGVQAARQATNHIPIVIAAILVDPVSAGFVASFAQPGGNITGLASQYEEVVTKQVQLLTEAVSGLSRLVFLGYKEMRASVQATAAAAAGTLGLKTRLLAGCGKTRHLMVELVEGSATMRVTHTLEARMRGDDRQQAGMWSYISPEQRVPADHPLRPIRAMVDTILAELSPEFTTLYSPVGRPSIPPEKLLRALLLQVLYSTRSERLLMEQLDYNLLFRWFVGLNMDDAIWDPTVFTKNRERLLAGDIAQAFFTRVLAQARQRGFLSDEHFTVDGTLIEAWASLKSFKRKDAPSGPPPDDPGNPTVDFHGERRSNSTHVSTTDPDARLFRKATGHEAKLVYQGHVLMENRHGLAVEGCVTRASGYGERAAALEMLGHRATAGRITVGADKGYDTRDFVEALRLLQVTPHVAQNTSNRASAIDARTTRHAGYEVSQGIRKRIEEIFGWLKTVGLLRKTRHRGRRRVSWMFLFSLAVYNLVRIRNLAEAAG
jgi:transposase